MDFPSTKHDRPCKHGHGVDRDRSGRCRECHRRQEKLRYRDDPVAFMARRALRGRPPSQTPEARHKWALKNPEKMMLHMARNRAKAEGYACTLTVHDIVIPEFCPLLGLQLERNAGVRKDTSPSLDKIEPELGYVPGNVWVVSWRANRIKNDATLAELQLLVHNLAERMR